MQVLLRLYINYARTEIRPNFINGIQCSKLQQTLSLNLNGIHSVYYVHITFPVDLQIITRTDLKPILLNCIINFLLKIRIKIPLYFYEKDK